MRETPVRETGGATAVTRLIRCSRAVNVLARGSTGQESDSSCPGSGRPCRSRSSTAGISRGSSIDPPAATRRTPSTSPSRFTSLSRKPAAPASTAANSGAWSV